MQNEGFNNRITHEYHVALSFAGEDREYVKSVALILRGYGVKVFYDEFEEANLWGKDLFSHLNEVYKTKAKYTIMFISSFYKNKLWTTHERKSMQERAFKESEEYILPARFDDTEIPGLFDTVGYINLKNKSPSEFSEVIIEKLDWKVSDRWWGMWSLDSNRPLYQGGLFIKNVDEEGFTFELYNMHGAHTGDIDGKAIFESKNEALFISKKEELDDSEEEPCQLKFVRTNDIIQVTESIGCRYYHGMRSYFDGDYKLEKDVFYDLKILNDETLSKIYLLLKTEENWLNFIQVFGDVDYDEEQDKNEMQIISGGVAGLYTIYEGILMVSPSNEIWGAYLFDEKVHYFTSENNNVIPSEINEWKERFDNVELVYL